MDSASAMAAQVVIQCNVVIFMTLITAANSCLPSRRHISITSVAHLILANFPLPRYMVVLQAVVGFYLLQPRARTLSQEPRHLTERFQER